MGRSTSLAPGFRFHPTDEELVRFYLKRKVTGKSFRLDPIGVIDVYKSEPWDLPCQSKLKTRDLEWYFFSALDKKYGNGSRTNRATEKGYWKTTGKDRPVRHGLRTVGMKKTLVYHSGRAPRGVRTNWVMHEYKLDDEELAKAGIVQDAFVLCRIFQKSGAGPKNGERYGAPLIEEEWEDDDEVAIVPGDDALTGVVAGDAAFVETSDPEQALTGVVAGDIAFVETDDLEQKLDMGVAYASAGLPSNFYYGESSRYPESSPEFIKDQKPLVGTVGISEPNNGQFFSMPEQYIEDIKSVADEANGELSHNGNPPYTLDDLYLDAMNYPLTDDGSFLETNDLVNPAEANLTGGDPSGTDILDEYLTYFDADEDISQYISFDSPQNLENENPNPDQGPSFIQQNVDGGTKDVSMANQHDFEAHSSNEASSSKQNPQASKLVSGNTFSFIQHANNLLDTIPAPPAFASEFPPKDIALQLHSAGQSSNSANVTAGMVRISNVTLRGNEMDWMLGKNGELNFVISSGFSQPDINSAALEPVSGLLSSKTAFVLSHGWVFLMCFSVLILSMSFKIGCSMYTGK